MDEIDLVIECQCGNLKAFERLVIKYQRKIFGYAMNKLKNHTDAEEVVQETFLKAFTKINNLKNPKRFGSWLFTICTNCIYGYSRKKYKEYPVEVSEIESIEDERQSKSEWDSYFDVLRISIGLLKPNQREVIQLRYFVELSYNEIAKLCNVTVKLVKSRLFEAKKKIKASLPHLYQGIELLPNEFKLNKEIIMKSVDLIKKGAYVLARLSLIDQLRLCNFAQSQEKFDEKLLKEIGKIKYGIEFVKGYDARLNLDDLVDIINYGDAPTEARIIRELDKVNPEFSETIKQNLFVFEDFIMFDKEAIKALFERIDRKILKIALLDCSPKLRNHILSDLSNIEKDKLLDELQEMPHVKMEEVIDAHVSIIKEAQKMDHEDLFEVTRPGQGVPVFRLKKK